jgi:antitoxin component YwqK of YwqJK toxin-antitoxin module
MQKLPFLLFLAVMWGAAITVAAQSTATGLQRCSEEPSAEIEGTLANSSSTRPKMKVAAGSEAPRPGDRGELQKYFETELFGGTVKGWLVIGLVEALATSQGVTEFKVLEAKSTMTVNGQAKSHFVAGKRVKFLEYAYSEERHEVSMDGGYRSEGPMMCGRRVGEWKKFAPNGNLIELYRYDEEGKFTGVYNSFYEDNGAKEIVGKFVSGNKHGLWECFYEDGQYKYSKTYDMGIMVGPYREWHPNGKLQEEGNLDSKGARIGEWNTYRENGLIFQRMNHGVKGASGTLIHFKSYGEAGELRQEGYLDETRLLQGPHTSYYNHGGIERVAHYEGGKLKGPYKAYHLNGNVSVEGAYGEGAVKKGSWKEYYENGKQQSEIEFRGETGPDIWKYWHSNGNLIESGYYLDGKKTGIWQTYATDGTPQTLHHYSNGKLSGPFSVWHPDGTLAEKGEYNGAGGFEGNYASYFPDGKLKEGGMYQNGKRIGKWVTRDEEGKKKVVRY